MPIRLYLADAVLDAAGVAAAPGAVAVHNDRVLGAGPIAEVRRQAEDAAAAGSLTTHRLPGRLLMPGLVNAHAHLDLTAIGPLPYIGNFTAWVQNVIRRRPSGPADIGRSVRRGLRLSHEAGVLRVGDIASSAAAQHQAQQGDSDAEGRAAGGSVGGVSFRELFGSAEGAPLTVAGGEGASTRFGLQPHAPYSARPNLYAAAARVGAEQQVPLCTHLAETEEEIAFTAEVVGPFRDLLVEMGKWDDRLLDDYGHGLHPVDWLDHALPDEPVAGQRENATEGGALPGVGWLCAHCNYVEDRHIATLARRGWSVAYCPRASAYFGHRGHRYRQMLEAGVNVCLGTDSILCHGTLSVFDEMRYLHQRDGTDPRLLLRMATVNAMRPLGLDPADATLTPGAAAGLIAVGYDDRPGGRAWRQTDPAGLLAALLEAEPPPTITTLAGLAPGPAT